MSDRQQTHFELLGVPFWACETEIRAAYRRLALVYHPDRNNKLQRQVAQSKFQAIQEAYAVLNNPERRQRYHLQCLDLWDMKEYLSQFSDLMLTPCGLGLSPYSGERMLAAIKEPVPLLLAA